MEGGRQVSRITRTRRTHLPAGAKAGRHAVRLVVDLADDVLHARLLSAGRQQQVHGARHRQRARRQQRRLVRRDHCVWFLP